jgi:hypothetical protein
VLEQGGRPDLADARVVLDGPAPLGPRPAPGPAPDGTTPPVVGTTVDLADCPERLSWRVRAVDAGGRTGGWSRTVLAVAPWADFAGCATTDLPVPRLRLEPGRLAWEPGPGAGEVAQVESAEDPLFAAEVRRVVVSGTAHPVPQVGTAARFHRVRLAAGDRTGGWSRTVHQAARPVPVLVAHDPVPGELVALTVAVHRGLLRLAGGRGDLLAVLTVPLHYREDETRRHLAALTAGAGGAEPSGVRPLDGGETAALSHGTLYHPWTVVPGGTGIAAGTRTVPPDGAAAGVLARRTLARGAWVSPGLQVLTGALGVTPSLPDAAVRSLLAAGVDVLARRPEGVVALAARTLAAEPALEPIGVRRLLVLLRRLALQEGPTYVFEPHDHRFRAMVRRSFEEVLGRLHQRGAFAGTVPAESFRVVVDAGVNPAVDVDAGRFVVELQVAPAQPLVFLRVRLVQTGSGALALTEVA